MCFVVGETLRKNGTCASGYTYAYQQCIIPAVIA